jgi:hypothetical protein
VHILVFLTAEEKQGSKEEESNRCVGACGGWSPSLAVPNSSNSNYATHIRSFYPRREEILSTINLLSLLLGTFTLKGKIISKDQLPLKDLKIEAYDDDPLLNPHDFLGEAITDSHGLYRIDFDESKFKEFLEGLEGTPDVYIVLKDNQGNRILTTKVMQTKKEIEYHIRVVDNIPNPNAIDIYSGNARRMISMLNEVGSIIGIENRIDLDILNKGDPPEEVREKLQNFINGYEERKNNFNHFSVILSTLVDPFFEELQIGGIGYDGPKVPRQPRREGYNQVITWPRQEEFKWA